MELSVPRCSSSRSRRLRAVATKRRLWELSKSEHAVGIDPMAPTFYPAEFYMVSHHLATLISQTSNVCQAILESVTQQKVPFHPEESGHDDDRGVQAEFVPDSAYVAVEDSIESQDVPPDMTVEKIVPTLNPDAENEAKFIGNPWLFLLPEECAMISTTCLSNWENCHRRCTELSNCHRRIIIAQLQEKTAQFQQELESLRTVNANLKFMNAKLVAENKEVTDMVATDMTDMVRAECERLSSQQAESLTALQNDHIEIQNDHIKRLSQKADTNEKECTKLATENRELQRKYQSLKDMYLDLCAKS